MLPCFVLFLGSHSALAQPGAADGEWRHYGGDLFSSKYSPLDQIDAENIGDGDHVRNHPDLKELNLPPLGGDYRAGPVLTKTLLFLGLSTQEGKSTLTAYDKVNGDVVGEIELPGRPIGTPMTYMVDGKQYIAVTISANPPELVAFALP